MKNKLIISAVLVTGCFINMDVYAADSGVYVEANGGIGHEFHNGFNKNDNKFAYSGDIGYQLNSNVGIELGYSRFSDLSSYNYLTIPGNLRIQTGANKYYNNYFTDLAIKGSYDLSDQFGVFGKLGAAYTHQQQHLYNNDPNANYNYQSTSQHLTPFLAGGVSYHLTSAIDLNAQIQGAPTSGKQTDMVAGLLGVTYHFN